MLDENAEIEAQEAEAAPVPPADFVASVATGDNLVAMLADGKIDEIARTCLDDYDTDKSSMQHWLDAMQAAIDLAALVKEDKNYPFDKASNIKFPLVTTAALQFNARAYPAIVPSSERVKCRVWGEDPNGAKADRGDRVASWMSYQLSTRLEEWDEDTDNLLMMLPIVGDMFRKVWWEGRERTRLVQPGKFIVNDNAQSLETAPRCTEEITLYPYEIDERIRSGWYADFDYHTTEEDQEPQELIEQHTRIDLDGDGYPEPYVATVHVETRTLVRLVADFGPEDVEYETETVLIRGPMGLVQQEIPVGIRAIRRGAYFVHYQFMPSLRGGFWGTGLGVLLADISSGINTAINMMIDAAHYAALGGGFIGSEFRLKGGNQRMRPGEWMKTAATGGDIRSAVVPMQFRGSDATMYQLLGLLIDAGKDVSSTKDIITGENAQNMTATTAMALVEQGMKVFTAAYKRVYRALQREFRLLARINATYLDPQTYSAFLDTQADPRADFDSADMDIQPVADPNAVTKMQEMARAQLLREEADAGRLDPAAATRRVLEAASIENVDELLPQATPEQQAMMQMQMQMQQMQMQAMQADLAMKVAEIDLTIAKTQSEGAKAMATMAEIEREAKRVELDAMLGMLREQREGLNAIIAGSRERVAGASGNGSA